MLLSKFLNCKIWLFAIFPADKIKKKKDINYYKKD